MTLLFMSPPKKPATPAPALTAFFATAFLIPLGAWVYMSNLRDPKIAELMKLRSERRKEWMLHGGGP
jgi:hypothetical protein